MAIDQITTGIIKDDAVTADKIVAGAVDADIAANSIDAAQIVDNITLPGSYAKMPSITTTQRDALTGAVGMIIYNSTIGNLQQYGSAGWVSIAAPPAITSITYPDDGGVTTTALDSGSGAGTQTLLINGSNFTATVTVEINVGGSVLAFSASTSVNAGKNVITCTNVTLRAAADDYTLKVTNTTGLSASTTVNFSADPGFTTAAALGTVFVGATLNKSIAMTGDGTLVATNGTPNKPTWMTVAGNTSTADNGASDTTFNATGSPLTLAGTIANSGTTETFTFGIIVRDSQNQTFERDYSLIAEDASTVSGTGNTIATYTDSSDGFVYRTHVFLVDGTLVLPIAKTVQYFMIGGGGAGGGHHGGGGSGAGALTDSAASWGAATYTMQVGDAGVRWSSGGTGDYGGNGQHSVISGTGGFSSLTASRGMGGAYYPNHSGQAGVNGSGGGGYNGAGGTGTLNSGGQTQSSGTRVAYGGHNGAARSGGTGPGGGGAGTGGAATTRMGGIGVSNYYRDGNHSGTTPGIHRFGGGGGGGNDNNPFQPGDGVSSGDGSKGRQDYGGGTGQYGPNGYNNAISNVIANSGAGGFGSSGGGGYTSGHGGTGIIVVRFRVI